MSLLSRREVFGMVSGVSATIVLGLNSAQASDSTEKDSVKVEVEGQLGLIVRQENSDFVTATILAGGGEFVVDGNKSDAAKKDLLRLADKYIKLGSSVVLLPKLKGAGRLEFRPTKMVGENGEETEGAKAWVLIADSVTERGLPAK